MFRWICTLVITDRYWLEVTIARRVHINQIILVLVMIEYIPFNLTWVYPNAIPVTEIHLLPAKFPQDPPKILKSRNLGYIQSFQANVN